MRLIKILLLCGLSLCFSVYAEGVDRYPLPSPQQQQQFQNLINQLRCLVCQNQNLADSNADLAKDLRAQVYNMVLAKKTDAQIKDYMTTRYGDYILFKPPFNAQTALLWLGPLLLLAPGFFILWKLTRTRVVK